MTTSTFDFSSGAVSADTTPDGAGRAWVSQTIGGNTLTLTANEGFVSVVDEDVMTSFPDTVMREKIFTVDYNGPAPAAITMSLDGGKVFDLTSLSLLDLGAQMTTLRITTNRGVVDVPIALQTTGQVLTICRTTLA